MQVNIHEAKTNLSKLISAIERGDETEVVIARNGQPTVKIVAVEPVGNGRRKPIRFGLAKGKFVVPDNIDELNPEIEKLFYGEDD